MLIQTGCTVITVFGHEGHYADLWSWFRQRARVYEITNETGPGFVALPSDQVYREFVSEWGLTNEK